MLPAGPLWRDFNVILWLAISVAGAQRNAFSIQAQFQSKKLLCLAAQANLIDRPQAEDRNHRIGQDTTVTGSGRIPEGWSWHRLCLRCKQ